MVDRCLLPSYQLHVSALMTIQVDELTKNTHKQLHLACVFYTEDGWRCYWMEYEISCVLGREGVCMGVYYANLSIVQFRAMILGIHVYVYIGYMVIDTQ